MTKERISTAIKSVHHAFMMIGSDNSSFESSINYFIKQSNIRSENVHYVVAEENKEIAIDQVRHLYKITKSVRDERQLVVIDKIHTMSHPAQNALLKLLEEPPRNVIFLLTTTRHHLLLPTITSRVAIIQIQPLTHVEAQTYAHALTKDESLIQKSLYIARGQSDELMKLLQDETYYKEQELYVKIAKEFIGSDKYTRLTIVKQFKERSQAIAFATHLGYMVTIIATNKTNPKMLKSCLLIADCIDRLKSNVDIRTSFTAVALKL